MTQEENKLKHIEKDTKIVILGTFPSEASRDTFFYHKLYSDTDLNESILYSLLTSICWFVVLFIILEFV